MKAVLLAAWLALACGAPLCRAAEPHSLPRSTPEAQGVSSAGVLAFVEAADRSVDSMNSLMVVRHGKVVAEGWWAPYRAEAPHSLYSLSKSFTSTAVGLAIAEKKLRLDDPVLKFFPDDAPAEPSANLKSMRVSDLLRMSTGQQTEPGRKPEEAWTKTFLKHPVPFKPGTHFLYNTSATYMLSAIVQKATGQTLLDYLKPRLFEPLGITHPTWESSPQGISTGGYGLSVRTEDIAKFGQLYLQKGQWNGKTLVPASWVAAATARQTSNGSSPQSDWDQGYGYQFWRSRHGAYRGDGAFGQFCIVFPKEDAVVAITSGTKDMQGVLNLVWDKLLPAFKADTLATDDEARAKLESRLRSLTIKHVEGTASPAAGTDRRFTFESNPAKLESVRLEKGDAADTLVIKADGAEQRIACGHGTWKDTRASFGTIHDQPAAATGGWTAADTYTARVCLYETPFIETLRLKFDGDKVTVETEWSVGFGPTRQPAVTGKAE